MFDLIPEAKREAVERGLRAAFDTTAIDSVTPIGGGLSSALVYRIVIKARPYLLRIATRVDAFNDPHRHFACLRIAAEAGLAPAVHHANPDAAFVITDFIAAAPMAVLQRPRPALLADLAASVRQLQATTPFPPLVDYLDAIDKLIAEVRALGLLPDSANEVFDRYAQIPAVYPRVAADQVSSHNDLNPNNTLWDGQRLWMVDWEAAFRNDRYVDPACVCNFFTANPEDERTFLTAYFGGPASEHQRARVYLMQQACHMFFAVMLFRMGAAAQPGLQLPPEALQTPPLSEMRRQMGALIAIPDGQLRLGAVVLNEVLGQTRTSRFAEALRAVR